MLLKPKNQEAAATNAAPNSVSATIGSSQSGSCLSSLEAITIAAGFRTTLPLPLSTPARTKMKVQAPSLFPHNLGLKSGVYRNVFD